MCDSKLNLLGNAYLLIYLFLRFGFECGSQFKMGIGKQYQNKW